MSTGCALNCTSVRVGPKRPEGDALDTPPAYFVLVPVVLVECLRGEMLLIVRVLDWSRTPGTARVIRPDYLSVCARRWFQRSGKRLFARPGLGSELSPLAEIVWAGTAVPLQGVMCKNRWDSLSSGGCNGEETADGLRAEEVIRENQRLLLQLPSVPPRHVQGRRDRTRPGPGLKLTAVNGEHCTRDVRHRPCRFSVPVGTRVYVIPP